MRTVRSSGTDPASGDSGMFWMASSTNASIRVTSVTFRGIERRRGAAIMTPFEHLAADGTGWVRHRQIQ